MGQTLTGLDCHPWLALFWPIKKNHHWDAGVAHPVKHLMLGFGSGHDLRVMGLNPMMGFMLGMEPTFQKIKFN